MRLVKLALGGVLLLLGLCLAIALVLRPPEHLAVPEQGASLRSVVLVVPGAWRSEVVDVEVVGQRIASVTPARSAQVNGYVLPGLTDAHMHDPSLPFPGHEELFAFLYLYHGVTQVRMAAGDNLMRDAISAGEYPGPTMRSCGPFLDGQEPMWPDSLVVVDESSAADAVQAVADAGYDCIKVYNELTAPASLAIRQQARLRGLPVIGHVPWRQDFTEAEIDDLQHVVGWAPRHTDDADLHPVRRLLHLDALDDVRIAQLVETAQRRSLQLTPTLITLQRKFAMAREQGPPQARAAGLLPRFYWQQLWDPDRGLVSTRLLSEQDRRQFEQHFPKALRAVKQLHAAGVELHSGTDAPAEAIIPGAGLLEELALLQEAGLTAEEVLAVSTVASFRRVLTDDLPQLRPGAQANFVLYEQDPTLELAHLQSRRAVVVEGRYYSRDALKQQLETYRTWFNGAAYRRVSEALVGLGLWLLNLATAGESAEQGE